jgi:hypothetical protein
MRDISTLMYLFQMLWTRKNGECWQIFIIKSQNELVVGLTDFNLDTPDFFSRFAKNLMHLYQINERLGIRNGLLIGYRL